MTQERLRAIRRQEQLDAGVVLGLKAVEFLDYPDSYLTPSLDLRKDIAKMIRKHRPDVLITNSPSRDLNNSGYIGHPDHMAAGEAALSAAFPTARDRLTYRDLLEEGYEPHKTRQVWVMHGGEGANKVIELTDEDLAKSIGALKAHKSQVAQDVDQSVKDWKARNGEPHGARFAETYRVFDLR
jgi:LmbE family N-acetylglucosaminyl deacetylase